jgi:hypothetical protein
MIWISLRKIQGLSRYSSVILQRSACKLFNLLHLKRGNDISEIYCLNFQTPNILKAISVPACNGLHFRFILHFIGAIQQKWRNLKLSPILSFINMEWSLSEAIKNDADTWKPLSENWKCKLLNRFRDFNRSENETLRIFVCETQR